MKSFNQRSTHIFVLGLLVLAFAGTAQAQDVQVNSANPNSAEQGTVDLNVEIAGTGFDKSAAVEFLVTGTTNPGGITVKKVKVRGSKKIIVTIDVDAGAEVADFDIEVRLSNGRKGKGTTLFKVQQKTTGKPSDDYTSSNSEVQFNSPSGIAGFHYHIIGTPDQEEILAGSGSDFIEAGASTDYIEGRGNDDVIYGEAGSDQIDGGDGADILDGGSGDDSLIGGYGTDYLLGGAGNDYLEFSVGQSNGAGYDSDFYDGGSGDRDMISFHYGSEPPIVGITINLATRIYVATVGDPAVGLTNVTGTFENIEGVFGSVGDDTIYGTDGPDHSLHGGNGSDIIRGQGGDDWNIDGGPGDDYLYGGPGDDNLHGDGGADIMDGGDGIDRLMSRGDEANDQMTGGAGCDEFFLLRRFGTDTITDFEDGCDYFNLSDYNPKYRLDFNDLSITESGSDIIIDFWFTKQGGTGGTIIIKDGVANGVTIDPSDFVF